MRRAKEARALARWSVLAPLLPRTPDGQLLLRIGCGGVSALHDVNIDARPLPHVHIIAESLFNLYMIPDSVADMIYMSHVLEHVSHRELTSTRSEFKRVSKTGGLLRLFVPDFDKSLDVYLINGRTMRSIERLLMGGQYYSQNFHYSIFNEDGLRNSLQDAGMIDVKLWDASSCDNHDFTDWSNRPIEVNKRQFNISLNISARAP